MRAGHSPAARASILPLRERREKALVDTRIMRCHICEEFLGDRTLSVIRTVTRNRSEAIFKIADNVVHRECYDASGLRPVVDEAERRLVEVEQGVEMCAACGEEVVDVVPFSFDLLTTRYESGLGAYNFLMFHPEHLASWSRYPEFVAALDEAAANGYWSGPGLLIEPIAHWEGESSRLRKTVRRPLPSRDGRR